MAVKFSRLVSIFLGLILVGLTSGNARWPLPPNHVCPKISPYPCKCIDETDDGIAVYCENTNLASLAVGLRQIDTLVKNLTIENCNIERLYGDVFRTLNITKLIIKDTPIREIYNDTFIAVGPSIINLHIINSQLEKLPVLAFKELTNVQLIEIDKSPLEELPANAFFGLPKLKTIKISNSRIQKIIKQSLAGQKKLKFLRIFKNNISSIERGSFDVLKSLELLDISYNHVSRLEQHYFAKLTKLTWLNLTSNGITEFSSRNFGRNQVMAVLHLAENNITKLDASSFRGMRFMRRVYFAGNQISQIGRQTFQAMRRIGGIYLANNLLTKIDYQMFDGLQFCDSIDLSNNIIEEVQKQSFKGLYLTNINMSYNAISEIPKEAFIQADNMTLDLSHNILTNIHPEGFDEDSYCFSLNLSHNALTSMSQVPMQYQRGIKFLDLSHNQISDIPKNTFPKLYELNSIDFSHNNISKVHRSVFTPLFSLRHLYFRHNNLATVESSTFGKLPTLLDLDLRNCNIRKIKRGAFGGLISVRFLYLDNNFIDEIPKPPISLNHMYLSNNSITEIKGRQPWPVMNSLISMDLDFNNLGDSLGDGRFNNLNVLQILRLRNNNITKPPWEALRGLQSLRTLNLDNNNITTLGKSAFGRLPVCFVLTMHGNQINNVTYLAFEGLLQLIHLDMSNNDISYIPPGAFLTLVSLQELNLSHNRLEKLENKTNGLLEDCLSLRKIDLSHNNIGFVTKKMFPQSRWIPYALEHIDLSFNKMPVLTKGIQIGTSKLKYLNVSNNIINDIRTNVLGNLTSLNTLDMSNNQLTDSKLRADRWGGILPNLTNFNIAYNRLYNIPAEHLAKCKQLKSLDISGNQIIHYYPVLTKLIKAGLDVKYEGNILRCECSLRPVVHWLRSGGRKGPWDDAKCNSPGYLAGRPVSQVREEQLVCDNSAQSKDFKISPDVKFRDVDQKSSSSLALSWFVNTNEDVADFRVELKSQSKPRPRTLLIKDIGYNARYDVIDSVPSGEQLTMCLLIKTSLGKIRRWREDQCQNVGPFSGSPISTPPTSLLWVAIILAIFNYR